MGVAAVVPSTPGWAIEIGRAATQSLPKRAAALIVETHVGVR